MSRAAPAGAKAEVNLRWLGSSKASDDTPISRIDLLCNTSAKIWFDVPAAGLKGDAKQPVTFFFQRGKDAASQQNAFNIPLSKISALAIQVLKSGDPRPIQIKVTNTMPIEAGKAYCILLTTHASIMKAVLIKETETKPKEKPEGKEQEGATMNAQTAEGQLLIELIAGGLAKQMNEQLTDFQSFGILHADLTGVSYDAPDEFALSAAIMKGINSIDPKAFEKLKVDIKAAAPDKVLGIVINALGEHGLKLMMRELIGACLEGKMSKALTDQIAGYGDKFVKEVMNPKEKGK